MAESPPIFIFPTTLASVNIANWFPTTMDRTSYLPWRSQFLDVLAIHDLSFVLHPDFFPPPENRRSAPDLASRKKFDCLVQCWMRATVSPAIQHLLLPCNSAYESWSLLDRRLNPAKTVHVPSLRRALGLLQKTPEKSMFDYLIEAKRVSDFLAAAGSPVAEHDLVDCILEGLGDEYMEFFTKFDILPAPPFEEIYELLLEEEALILQSRLMPPAAVLPSEACQICYFPGHSAMVCPQREDVADDDNYLSEVFQNLSVGDATSDFGNVRSDASL